MGPGCVYPALVVHYPLVIQHSHGQLPIYRWFTWVYLLKSVIFHRYVSHNQMVYFIDLPATHGLTTTRTTEQTTWHMFALSCCLETP